MAGLFKSMVQLFTGGPDTPGIPPARKPPERSDAEVQAAALAERRRRALASGRQSTILTGPGGGSTDRGGGKTLLGQ